jgi:hypothetical protein
MPGIFPARPARFFLPGPFRFFFLRLGGRVFLSMGFKIIFSSRLPGFFLKNFFRPNLTGMVYFYGLAVIFSAPTLFFSDGRYFIHSTVVFIHPAVDFFARRLFFLTRRLFFSPGG